MKHNPTIQFLVLLTILFIGYGVYYIAQKNNQNVVMFEVSEKDTNSGLFQFDIMNYDQQLRKTYGVERYGNITYNKQSEDIVYEKLKNWDSKTDPIFKLRVSTNELDWLYYGTAREIDSVKCILKDSILICSARVREVEKVRRITEEKENRDLEIKLKELAKKVGKSCN